MAIPDWVALPLSIGIPIVQGFISGIVFGGGDTDWYKSLKKPSWTPPGWMFPVVWTTLYIMMGTAAWLVWKRGGFEAQALPLGIYIVQLVLNFSWTPLFFGLHRIDLALAEILTLWAAVAATIIVFWSASRTASLMLLPYIAWVSVATSLNYYIYVNNPKAGADSSISEPLRSAE